MDTDEHTSYRIRLYILSASLFLEELYDLFSWNIDQFIISLASVGTGCQLMRELLAKRQRRALVSRVT